MPIDKIMSDLLNLFLKFLAGLPVLFGFDIKTARLRLTQFKFNRPVWSFKQAC